MKSSAATARVQLVQAMHDGSAPAAKSTLPLIVFDKWRWTSARAASSMR